ncbi:Di-copper centre-containing protein [Pseudovirgaria hyperparasitica]|uniref:tyrosinase n=1 Tax=Pseudovirgaria hyperparasitica TaxID=470096 RepID=A0A6A6W8L4_9PEZI|nr:Di-copper centre-containing protein [Pseudovirgaria hyperparasitica]KAF2757917.1 Di-copper centre-containing protein [Pseudovirgaria hyperparasitica]
MRFDLTTSLTWLLAASSFTDGVSASPAESSDPLVKRAYTAITGPSGNACSRLEVRDLQKNNPDQWNLFLLAMQNFEAMDQKDKFSYYQLSAVHGRPFTPWNDVARKSRSDGSGAGYCFHISNMFLPWHRPYLAAYEKAIDDRIPFVIQQFPADQRSRWERARNCFRLPYWDTARRDSGGETLPSIITDETVTMDTPTGRRSVPNPLAYYRFNSTSELGAQKWQDWQRTYREPTTGGKDAQSNISKLKSDLNTEQPKLKKRIYDLMTSQKEYRLFSTEATGGNTGNKESHDSLESVHDSAHMIIGSGSNGNNGHMWFLDYSAFDPIFWLHHCNMDRLGAIWQTINPNSYVVESRTTRDNAVLMKDSVTNGDTALVPFTQKTDGTMWTPNTARYTTTFGYYYPETGPGSTSDSAKAAVNNLYGPTQTPPTQNKDTAKPKSNSFNLFDWKRSFRQLSERTNEAWEGYAPSVGQREYIATLNYDKFAIDGSYAIYFFLNGGKSSNSTISGKNLTSHTDIGLFDSNDASTFMSSPNYVGMHGVLSSTAKMNQSSIGSAAIQLLPALQLHHDAGLLESLEENSVKAYLKQNLDWRVLISTGDVLTADEIPSLTIGVISKKVDSVATANTFPTYSDIQTHPEITADKPAGYSSEEPIPYSSPSQDAPADSSPGSSYEAPTGSPVGSPSTCTSEPVYEYVYVNGNGDYLYTSMS